MLVGPAVLQAPCRLQLFVRSSASSPTCLHRRSKPSTQEAKAAQFSPCTAVWLRSRLSCRYSRSRRRRTIQATQQQTVMARVAELLAEYQRSLNVSPELLRGICEDFVEQMKAGLSPNGQSSLLMIPTMVDILPDGHERGSYYAIDMGGTNLRVLHAKLSDSHGRLDAVEHEESVIPPEYHNASATELFDYLALKLISFAERTGWEREGKKRLVLGFCFSYPVDQTELGAGMLIQWTKEFNVQDAVGRDVVQLLQDAFHRQNVRAVIPALVNDTVGTLASSRYDDGVDNNICIIIGTGTNCCYVEQLSAITKWVPRFRPRTSDMVVNIEWAGFESSGLPITAEDRELDSASSSPGQHIFEKMTAGLYMGEVARLILLRLAREGQLFGEEVPARLQEQGSFTTEHMGKIHSDDSPDLRRTGDVLHTSLGLDAYSLPLETRQQVYEVCRLVGERGARLTAGAVCGILHHLGRDGANGPVRNVVAVDGAVLRKYHDYRAAMKHGLADILGDEAAASVYNRFGNSTCAAEGAALLAAAATNYMQAVGTYPYPTHKY